MAFMQKQIQYGTWIQIETTIGTEIIPDNICECELDDLADYCEGKPLSAEIVQGFGARLSAPGYMDCTDWSVFDTESEAEEYLESLDDYDDEEQADEYAEGR